MTSTAANLRSGFVISNTSCLQCGPLLGSQNIQVTGVYICSSQSCIENYAREVHQAGFLFFLTFEFSLTAITGLKIQRSLTMTLTCWSTCSKAAILVLILAAFPGESQRQEVKCYDLAGLLDIHKPNKLLGGWVLPNNLITAIIARCLSSGRDSKHCLSLAE